MMANTNLFGPYELKPEIIENIVKDKAPGTYVLEREQKPDSFIVNYVGRSDNDLNARLKQWCGGKYKRFKYGYFPTPFKAYQKECSIYHNFSNLDNLNHPDKGDNKEWKCPVCGV